MVSNFGPVSVRYYADPTSPHYDPQRYEPESDPHYIDDAVDEEVMFVASLVPEIEYLSWDDALELAIERDREIALNLKAAVLEARALGEA